MKEEREFVPRRSCQRFVDAWAVYVNGCGGASRIFPEDILAIVDVANAGRRVTFSTRRPSASYVNRATSLPFFRTRLSWFSTVHS